MHQEEDLQDLRALSEVDATEIKSINVFDKLLKNKIKAAK